MLIVAFIPATFIGILKFGVELAYGHSVWVSLGPALVFFGLVYVLLVVGVSIASLVATKNKAKNIGVSLDYLGGLPKKERVEFEKKHGF